MSKWLKLSDGVFMFGEGGITRFEATKLYLNDGSVSPYKTALYTGTNKVSIVTNSETEIHEMLSPKTESDADQWEFLEPESEQ